VIPGSEPQNLTPSLPALRIFALGIFPEFQNLSTLESIKIAWAETGGGEIGDPKLTTNPG